MQPPSVLGLPTAILVLLLAANGLRRRSNDKARCPARSKAGKCSTGAVVSATARHILFSDSPARTPGQSHPCFHHGTALSASGPRHPLNEKRRVPGLARRRVPAPPQIRGSRRAGPREFSQSAATRSAQFASRFFPC